MQRSLTRIGLTLLSIAATALTAQASASDKITCGITVRKDAEAACTRIIRNPTTKPADRFMAYYNRGWYYRRGGDLDKSLADFDAAERVDRDFANLYLSRGMLKREQRDLQGALEDLDIYVIHKPKDWNGYFQRALVFRQMGKPDQAMKPLLKAIELKPFERDLKPLYALVLLDLGRLAEAVKEAESLVASRRSDPVSFYVRAVVAKQRGATQNAMADLKKALNRSILFPAAYALRGLILEERGETDEAKKAYRMSLKNGGPVLDQETSQDYAQRRLDELEQRTNGLKVSSTKVSQPDTDRHLKRASSTSVRKLEVAQDCRRYIPSAAATVAVPCGS